MVRKAKSNSSFLVHVLIPFFIASYLVLMAFRGIVFMKSMLVGYEVLLKIKAPVIL